MVRKTSINRDSGKIKTTTPKHQTDKITRRDRDTQNAPTTSVALSPNHVHSTKGETVDCSTLASESKCRSTASSGNIFNNLSISTSPLSSEDFKSSMINGDIIGSESATDPADEVFQGEPEASCSSADG